MTSTASPARSASRPSPPTASSAPRPPPRCKAVYDAVVGKKPLAAMTRFPVPDTEEEAAEYCQFIRAWLRDVASRHLLAEAGA
ncbi:MAG: hypothetical protein HS111_06440 [Kofleriaceae bacterium]|nr:hypothetical protein [Kofleriaceae bacterium]